MADDADEIPSGEDTEESPGATSRAHGCPIVGIGASAGGVDALRGFIGALAPDCGLAFVVVQHPDQDRPGDLAPRLAGSGKLPVHRVEEDMLVEPGAVHVIPPGMTLSIRERRLHLARPATGLGDRSLVDDFFTSLALDQGDNAACVILSGTGSDGTLGLRAVKEAGGLTLAQSNAEYGGMVRSAVETGLVDFVVPPEDMPLRLAEYFRRKAEADSRSGQDGMLMDVESVLPQIAGLLRSHTGNDFSNYKTKTIVRRVQRRMHVLRMTETGAFVERLRSHPHEVDLLFRDLLIGVTSFFRDRRAFEELERVVVPALSHGKGTEATVRIWSPGCATGEETYSLAIILADLAARVPGGPKIQIFASDIDERALKVARAGRYPATIARDIPPRRLERYFTREDGTYRVASELREMCLFSTHNLLRDAPFSRIDLISCRNLLIYFDAPLQDRVMPLFHYALNPAGYLFLGASENVTRHPRLFATIDKANRIFQRLAPFERKLPEFPLTPPDASRVAAASSRPDAAGQSLQTIAERQILERYAPAYVVINAEGEVLLSSGRTGKYLELPAGAPDNNLFNMARSGLRVELRAAIHRAAQSGRRAFQANVVVGTNGGQQEIDLYMQPIRQNGMDSLYMVVFQDLGGITSLPEDAPPEAEEGAEIASIRHLDMELRATKERLQTTTEELEVSNEELRSSNEELSSMNEELQSSNEELETSKEELQSINEELYTVNAELQARVDELGRINSDVANLLESTQIATVFLDRELTVKSFTPAAKDVFRLVESDTGRPITHVRARVEIETLQEDAARVLRTLGAVERQVRSTESDARYVLRILPYRTTDDVITGVVLTFTDVTRITAAEALISKLAGDLRDRAESLERLLDLVPVGVFVAQDAGARNIVVNHHGSRLIGQVGERTGLRPITAPFQMFRDGEELPLDRQPLQRAVRAGEPVSMRDGRLVRADGGTSHVMISATPLFDDYGAARGGIAAVADVSEIKEATRQQLLLHELQHRVKNILATISSLATRMTRSRLTVAEFHTALLARLAAMGRIHDTLSRGAWTGADLRSVVDAVLDPHKSANGSNVGVSGPDVLLVPNTASTLGLVFHELATNATKYGALSVQGGRVEVTWTERQTASGTELAVAWTERGGPAPEGDRTEGFGTSFVRRAVEYDLQGAADFDFTRDGLVCAIAFPLQGNAMEVLE